MYVVTVSILVAVFVLVWIAAAYFPAKWLARRLGLADFCLFDVNPTGTWGRRAMVRGTSVLASLALVFVAAFASRVATGNEFPTNRVGVMPGPAMEAGLLDNDRIISIDGITTADFDAIRRALKPARPTHEFRIERDGTQVTMLVQPNEQGAVKIVAKHEHRPIGAGAAASDAAMMLVNLGKHFLSPASSRSNLAGPVAIVSSAEKSPATGAYFTLIALYGTTLTLLLIVCHLFDGLTGLLFRVSSSAVDSRTDTGLDRPRLMRRRQALAIAVIGILAVATVATWIEIDGGSMEPVAGALLGASAGAVPPLVWLLTRQLYGRVRAVATTAALVVPVVNLGIVVWLWIAAGRAVRRQASELNNGLQA